MVVGKICPMAIAAVSTPGKILFGKAVPRNCVEDINHLKKGKNVRAMDKINVKGLICLEAGTGAGNMTRWLAKKAQS